MESEKATSEMSFHNVKPWIICHSLKECCFHGIALLLSDKLVYLAVKT